MNITNNLNIYILGCVVWAKKLIIVFTYLVGEFVNVFLFSSLFFPFVWFGLVSLFNGISTFIIIMSCRQHGFPWPSLATSPYRSSLPVGLQGHISYPHIAAECMFELVVLLLLGHMWGSIGVHHYELVPASPAVSCISGSSNLDSFRDGRQVAV